MAKKSNIAASVAAFVSRWTGKGYEKGETQRFWLDLIGSVFGVQNPMSFMEFEVPVKTILKEKGSDFIDAYIPSTKVLIEQKGSHVDLSVKARQSDGTELTPYQQARRYASGLPVSMAPRWIVVCNFVSFEVHDMEKPSEAPQVVKLADLEKEYYRLSFLVDDTAVHTKKEVEVSMAAGSIIGEIFDAFRKEYRNPEDPHSQRSLNILCVRLVFCLYAEDAGLFDSHSQFHDYLVQFKPGTGDMRRALIELFDVLNTPVPDRDPYLRDDLMAFPYVNGGLFAEKDIEIPRFTQEIADLLLRHASDDFDWSQISPTIFGGVFESTLNPETRRKGGMHYTSIENIHKVIDPLFLDDLKKDLAEIKAEPAEKKRIAKAKEFQEKISGLKFLDPACGSGNFLTETFISLRRLENECLRIIYKGQMVMGDIVNPIKVSIGQFYGIEINDFAVSVAMTALWIAEAQMLFETEKIMQVSLDFLPLKSYTNIHEGNALRIDWNDVIDCKSISYIMGNPPFIGYAMQSKEQKEDILSLYVDKNGRPIKGSGKIDYVAGWYYKSGQMMQSNPSIRAALVSTNSITQGEQVANLWKPLYDQFSLHINFAWRTFIWDSEANQKAHVHCVIVGFSSVSSNRRKVIYSVKDKPVSASNINPYLIDFEDVFIESRKAPLCDVPAMVLGNIPRDGGFLSNYSDEDKNAIVKAYPSAASLFRRIYGSVEFINSKTRWCLWLKGISPSEFRAIPPVVNAVDGVRQMREASDRKATQVLADYPTLFAEIRQPDTFYLAVPEVSSGNRKYIPMGYLSPDIICTNKLQLLPNATPFHFSVMNSIVHMAWVRAICGRLKSDYDYSSSMVYNNFPWPSPSDVQRYKIESTAKAILDARALYPDSSLADLYDDLTMPAELRKAHRANDAAVMEAYGFRKDMTEPEIVAELFKMYQKMVTS